MHDSVRASDLAVQSPAGESASGTALTDAADRALHANLAHFTGGLSPAALAGAYWDWAVHLAASPGKQMQLAEKAWRKAARFGGYAARAALQGEKAPPCIEPLPQDKRFLGEEWRRWPYNLIYQSFLLNQQWWHSAATDVGGVTKQHENVVDFVARQLLDMYSPSNFLLTNPQAQKRTLEQGGANLLRGFQNFLEDLGARRAAGSPSAPRRSSPAKISRSRRAR